MTDDGGYDLAPKDEPRRPNESPAEGSSWGLDKPPPKPGDPDFVPPPVLIERAGSADESVDEPPPGEPPPDPDVETHKGLAALGYVVFLIPLLAAPNSKYARFHANQGLLAFIVLAIAVVTVVGLQVAKWINGALLAERVTILSMFFGCGFSLLQAGLLVGWFLLVVQGIANAASGEAKNLPVVGHFRLIT